MSRALRAAPLAIILALIGLLFVNLSRAHPDAFSSELIGHPIADFSIPLLNNSDAFLTPESWKGKVTLVNIFASWCSYCQLEHETLMQLSAMKKILLIGIAWKDKPEHTARWLAERGNPFDQVGLDTRGDTTLAFGLSGVPETLLIDRNGIVVYHTRSAITQTTLDTEILPLIERLHAQ